jgi:hypothetical protein
MPNRDTRGHSPRRIGVGLRRSASRRGSATAARDLILGEEHRRAKEFFLRWTVGRVALRFVPVRVASWDHRKLGGVH